MSLTSRLISRSSPGSPFSATRGAWNVLLLNRELPLPPMPPRAAATRCSGAVKSARTSSVSIFLTIVPTGTLTMQSAPSAPSRCLPAPCAPFLATWRGLCRSSMSVLIPCVATKRTSPPLPPLPPSGPPRGTYFSRRKLMHPLPPLPALMWILAVSITTPQTRLPLLPT